MNREASAQAHVELQKMLEDAGFALEGLLQMLAKLQPTRDLLDKALTSANNDNRDESDDKLMNSWADALPLIPAGTAFDAIPQFMSHAVPEATKAFEAIKEICAEMDKESGTTDAYDKFSRKLLRYFLESAEGDDPVKALAGGDIEKMKNAVVFIYGMTISVFRTGLFFGWRSHELSMIQLHDLAVSQAKAILTKE